MSVTGPGAHASVGAGAVPRVIALTALTADEPQVLGNKGAGIVRMLGLGIPVPPAFALPIDECRRYRAAGGELEDETWDEVLRALAQIEQETGRRLGDPEAPLLVSVRSGAAVSMPGMMDTVLNLGINDAVEAGLAALSGDTDFARSTHARFCHGFGQIVLGADVDEPGPASTADELRALVLEDTGREVPTGPLEQLRAAIHAVFESWTSRRAKAYRRHWGISDDGGTAVIVQSMVFGNLGGDSGTGVYFTRNPLSGDPEPYGEWLPGGQGEDVVSGVHDCLPLSALATSHPDAHAELLRLGVLLERENGDVQDIEYTIEQGRLFLLQTRSAKRSPIAALRIAGDLVAEGLIDHARAVARVDVDQIATMLAPRLADGAAAGAQILAQGVAACPGVAAGRVVLDSQAACDDPGATVLVRPTTSPEDVSGMIAAAAIVTHHGGATSHAAVVSRALGRPSVVGIGDQPNDAWVGRDVTVDGSAGTIYAGILPTVRVEPGEVPGLSELLSWAAAIAPVNVVERAEGALDLDGAGIDAESASGMEDLAAAMRGATAVTGSVVVTEAGARAVIAAGIPTVVPPAGQREGTLLRLAQAAIVAAQDAAG
ncbi:unannotated protein [freshwater metagenome]|uniref:Unannotated protein n=1 Tax=freshwater metagenome TaxID=449393 RepID=A0A6J7IDT2_9ZZZZ|nr:pyruvate, phosphate dikinase [Actinomycetota bacterium]